MLRKKCGTTALLPPMPMQKNPLRVRGGALLPQASMRARRFHVQVHSALASCCVRITGVRRRRAGGLRGLAPPHAVDRRATKRSDDENEARQQDGGETANTDSTRKACTMLAGCRSRAPLAAGKRREGRSQHARWCGVA